MSKFYLISKSGSFLRISNKKYFFVHKNRATLFDEKDADNIIMFDKHYKFKKQIETKKFIQLNLFSEEENQYNQCT